MENGKGNKMSAVTPEFVKFYNYVFEYIDTLANWKFKTYSLEDFWLGAKDILLEDLKEFVESVGLDGAEAYWNDVLTLERAVFKIERFGNDKEADLVLSIKDCPSCRILGKDKYSRYCEHCQVMYPALFDELGYGCSVDVKGNGKCQIAISRVK